MGLPTFVLLTVIVVAVVGNELESNAIQDRNRSNDELKADNSIYEGRKAKHKLKGKQITYLLLAVKSLMVAIVLPSLLALALFASWKGITISLLAFTVASIVGIKNLLNSKSSQDAQHVLVTQIPSHQAHHEHWWRRFNEDPQSDSILAYNGHNHY